ncbi:MAG: hypothetical protein NZO58_10125, partial [Gemmataceae bacterium]|nr:hypothetical protein [Gemmataceae bacterium]
MDLICPTCQRRLTVEDRFAGMIVQCPLCSAKLQAPTLAPPMVMPPVPPPAEVRGPAPTTGSAAGDGPRGAAAAPSPPAAVDARPPATAAAPTDANAPPPAAVDPAKAPPSAREYARKIKWHLRVDIVACIAPVSLLVILATSFFAWYQERDAASLRLVPRNLWELAFTSDGQAIYTFYVVVLLFVTLPLTLLVTAVDRGWLPLPPALRELWQWRLLLLGGA